MVRIGVDGGASTNSSSAPNVVHAKDALPPPLLQRATTHATLDRAGSQSSLSFRKAQLMRSLSQQRDLLLTPPQQIETPKSAVVTREMLRAMPLRPWLRYYLSRPEESTPGWVLHHVVLITLVVNTCVLALETLDGPHFAGAAPSYAFLPSAVAFAAVEQTFSALYVVEFAARWATASSQRRFWRAKHTWLELLALLPIVVDAGAQCTSDMHVRAVAETVAYNLRLARVLRIPVLSRVHVGSKVMFRALSKSVAPLGVTVFFLIAVVMVFATGIYYAEPCYDLEACTFTDIFNAGYFVMVSVATVGYGSQVPSLENAGSLLLACIVMLFGQLYLSMPLAIVGMNYNLEWRRYDDRMQQREAAQLEQQFAMLAVAPTVTHAHPERRASRHVSTLLGLPARAVLVQSHQILSMYCDLTQRAAVASRAIEQLLSTSNSSVDSPTTRDAVVDAAAKALDAFTAMLKLHKSLATEMRVSLMAQQARERRPMAPPRTSAVRVGSIAVGDSAAAMSETRRTQRVSSFVAGMFGKAKLTNDSKSSDAAVKTRYYHHGPATIRSVVWNIFEHNDYSRVAVCVNRARLLLIIASLALFYLQTTPELQRTGIDSLLCKRAIERFCSSRNAPGCFVFDVNGHPTTERLTYDCVAATTASRSTCYGEHTNFGSPAFALTCAEAFGVDGARRVCNNRLCKPSTTFMLDMEPHWVYLEFAFGALFTVEMLLRAYAHPARQMLWKDATLVVDILALFPVFVEAVELVSGLHPVFSIVPTEPSFFTGIRVLKSVRILKLGTHIPGARVLINTAQLVYQRLAIPLFFLFLGCVLSGAIFYELERGTSCYVGHECRWWGKNVLTPALAHDMPIGKRVLVQNRVLTILTDMLRSTWLALVTNTTVGYGDMVPRTSFGKLFDIVTMIFSACYTAMPLSLVGGQFYACYEAFVEDERHRRQSWNSSVEPTRHHSTPPSALQSTNTSAQVAPLNDAPTASATNGSKRQPGDGSELQTLPPLTASSGTDSLPAATSPSRPQASPTRTSMLMGPLQGRPGARVLTQFVAIQKAVTELMADVAALNVRASGRRVSLLQSVREPTDRETLESNVRANMRFVETARVPQTALLNCAAVIESIQDHAS